MRMKKPIQLSAIRVISFFMTFLSMIRIGTAILIPKKFLKTLPEKTMKKTVSFTASLLILSGFPTDAIAQNNVLENSPSQVVEKSKSENFKLIDFLLEKDDIKEKVVATSTYERNPPTSDSNIFSNLKVDISRNAKMGNSENSDAESINTENSNIRLFSPYNPNKWKLCYSPETKKIGDILLTEFSIVYAYDDKIDDDNNNLSDLSSKSLSNIKINNNGISSHIFYKNIFFNGWINIAGEYENVSEILCRVIWKDIWYV